MSRAVVMPSVPNLALLLSLNSTGEPASVCYLTSYIHAIILAHAEKNVEKCEEKLQLKKYALNSSAET